MSDSHFTEGAPTGLSQSAKKKLVGVGIGVLVIGYVFVTTFTGGEEPKQTKVAKKKTTADFEKSHQAEKQKNKGLSKKESDMKNLLSRNPPPPAPKNLMASPNGPKRLSNPSSGQQLQRGLQYQDQNLASSLGANNRTSRNMNGAPISTNAGASVKITEYVPPREVQIRMNSSYKAMIDHFKQKDTWSQDPEYLEKTRVPDARALVDQPLKNLYEGANSLQAGMTYDIPSGTRIIAVTEQKVNTDHPGYFTSRIVRPHVLAGSRLICQAGVNQNDRIPVQPVKIIFEGGNEIQIAGQIETDFAGLDGDVTSHYWARLGPAIGNAAIGGAFLAWSMNRENGEDRIDTRDAIVAPVVAQSVSGVQNEVSRLGGDFPNTVEVEAGKQFAILLTEPLKVVK